MMAHGAQACARRLQSRGVSRYSTLHSCLAQLVFPCRSSMASWASRCALTPATFRKPYIFSWFALWFASYLYYCASSVVGMPAQLGSKCPTKYASCAPQPFLQNWVEAGKLPAEGGVGYVGCTAKSLCVYAHFDDSHIFSTAQADQEKMWTLGDVFEVFVKPGAERTDYWEVHVTPNDFLMDIHIPDRDKPYTWAEAVAPGTGATKLVKVMTGSWAVELCIPW